MKKRILNIILIGAIGLTSLNCTDLIEDVSPDALPESSQTLTDVTILERLLVNTYQTMPIGQESFIQALMSDEARIATTNNGSGVFLWGRTFTSQDNDVEALWNSSYRTVFTANKVLDNIDNVTNNGANGLNKNQIKAEALGMRAFAHFIVLKNFSPKYSPTALGCAYMKSSNIENIYDTPPRSNMQDSYQNVLSDLNAALALNPTNNLNMRMSKDALNAIKSLVYLEMGDNANAITFANAAIGTRVLKGGPEIVTVPATNPKQAEITNIWTDPITSAGTNAAPIDGSEVIFQQINIAGAVSFNMGALYRSPALGVFWNASTTLKQKYNAGDYRIAAYYRTFGTPTSLTTVFNKYYGPAATPGIANIKAIRLAEMILVRAEAKAKTGDLAGAFADYDLIRVSRNAGASVAFTSTQDAIDKILDEKFREFPLEGKRMIDLKRNGKIVTRLSTDTTVAYPNTSFPNVDKMTLPIPYSEIFANPNMKQNVGW
ncbi:RagB/SusD family nutrient uptake outer membrane protein [Chryseobacterium mulctrae]|uniref:RagB/SusD family nutrient uptake outer membrane protein n=1 Tax=Chryseobacterium mulctrae TaxID=2576777 RepID=UPI001115B26E|nr:RagB/SusD family nutrient uptake outer membrane protein [Chryseobacterium mulctrae]